MLSLLFVMATFKTVLRPPSLPVYPIVTGTPVNWIILKGTVFSVTLLHLPFGQEIIYFWMKFTRPRLSDRTFFKLVELHPCSPLNASVVPLLKQPHRINRGLLTISSNCFICPSSVPKVVRLLWSSFKEDKLTRLPKDTGREDNLLWLDKEEWKDYH